jgi:hypothetical protein
MEEQARTDVFPAPPLFDLKKRVFQVKGIL